MEVNEQSVTSLLANNTLSDSEKYDLLFALCKGNKLQESKEQIISTFNNYEEYIDSISDILLLQD